MNRSGSDHLERLISRYLDREATPGEQHELEEALRRDRSAEALFGRTAALDRPAGAALRRLARGESPRRATVTRWSIWTRLTGGAIAASVAAACWVWVPRPEASPSDGGLRQQASLTGAGWFAPRPGWGDTLVEEPSDASLGVGLEATDRKWLVLPAEHEGEFLIVEVKRIERRRVALERDF